MTQKPERLEAALSSLLQWGPLTSDTKGKKEKIKKNPRDPRPQLNALVNVCNASMGELIPGSPDMF